MDMTEPRLSKICGLEVETFLKVCGLNPKAFQRWVGNLEVPMRKVEVLEESEEGGDPDLSPSDVWVYGPIVDEDVRSWLNYGVSSESFRNSLQSATPDKNGRITVRINSPGGFVDEAGAIYQFIQDKRADTPVDVKIDGIAASAASIIALAGEKVSISRLGTVFVHRPWSYTVGHAANMDASADSLKSAEVAMSEIYSEAMNFENSKWDDAMDLMNGIDGEGSWMNANDALASGYADEIAKAEPTSSKSSASAAQVLAGLKSTRKSMQPAFALVSEEENAIEESVEEEDVEEVHEERIEENDEEEEVGATLFSTDEADASTDVEIQEGLNDAISVQDNNSSNEPVKKLFTEQLVNADISNNATALKGNASTKEGSQMGEQTTAQVERESDSIPAQFDAIAQLASRAGVSGAEASAIEAMASGETPQEWAKRMSSVWIQDKPHQHNLEAARANTGNEYNLDRMVRYVAAKSTGRSANIQRAEATAAKEVEFARSYDVDKLPPDLAGNGELVPTSAIVGDKNIRMAATDTFSVDDVVPTDVLYGDYLEALIARTPILGLVNRRAVSAAVLHIPRVSSPPAVTERSLGINTGATVSGELTDPTDTDITIDHVALEPNALALNMGIGRPAALLTDGWLNSTTQDVIREQIANKLEETVVQGGQGQTGANGVAVTNAQYDASDLAGAIAIREILMNARGAVAKANISLLNGALVMGQDLYDHLAARPTHAGGGRYIIENGMVDTMRVIPSNQLAVGGANNQPASKQAAYAAWGHSTLATWDVTRIWTSEEKTMTLRLHMLMLYIWVAHYPKAFTKITVTDS